ncbi:adenylate/guanylate cyclase domain-containing protein [Candidatus Uhrbacteria bacterium]|nr:adenylate/guanylate cyclase domain-containing protein [Candidatus Uhrbacteria bacterium]
MALNDELRYEVRAIFKKTWTTRDGIVVPEPADLLLGNDAVNLEATVLYADMDGSTSLVDAYAPKFAAEVYKAYLHCAAKVIRSEDGVITAYDGDRIMGVFTGNFKNSNAVCAGLKIQWCVDEIINPAIRAQYPEKIYALKQTVGIDTGKLLVARTGVRGSNDLVWVGRAANYAAKLTDLDEGFSTWITDSVYKKLNDGAKYSNGINMWEERSWTKMGNMRVYRSNYRWPA